MMAMQASRYIAAAEAAIYKDSAEHNMVKGFSVIPAEKVNEAEAPSSV